jgi:hypothetical protein
MSHRIVLRTANSATASILPEHQNNALIETHGDWSILTRPDLEPTEMKDVWFITPESPLPALAQRLSEQLETVTLAVLNWENDVMKIWAFERGVLKLEYDSNPSFAACTIAPPAGDGAELARVVGVPDKADAAKKLLARKRGLGFINETQRLEQLSVLLGAPLV